MDQRFSRRLLGVAGAISLSASLLAPTSALSSEEPTSGNSLAMAPQPRRHSGNQLTAAVVLPPGVHSVQPHDATLDSTSRKSGEDEGALRNGLVHSSRGMQALTVGDRVKAQEELEISTSILAKISGVATSGGLRLQLIEETALLKAALSDASPGQEVMSQPNDQEEEEDEADTEAAPNLVAPEEAQKLAPAEGEIVSIPELDVSGFDVPIVLNEQAKADILY